MSGSIRLTTARRLGLRSSLVTAGAILVFAGTSLAAGWSGANTITVSGNAEPSNSHSTATVGSTIHVILWNDQSVAYSVSADGGGSFSAATGLATTSGSVTYDALGIAASGRHVVALYKSIGPGNKRSLLVRRSADGGTTWLPQQVIASYTNATIDMGDADVGISGTNVTIAWTDRTKGKVMSRRSTDGGATWKPNQLIGTTANPTAAGKEGDVTVAVAGSRAYIAWTPGNRKGLALRRSTDNGATWKPLQTLSTAPGGYPGPEASASGKTLLISYNLTSYAVKVARSTNGGATVTSSTVVSGNYQEVEDVVVSGSKARITYGDGTIVNVRSSADGGASWAAPDNGVIEFGNHTNLSIVSTTTVIVYGVDDGFSATPYSIHST